MKIAFLINNAYGIGGTIRATTNLSAAFSTRHDVEVVSVQRPKDVPQLTYAPEVKLTALVDLRQDSPTYEGDHPLTKSPCTMFRYSLPYTALEEQRIGDWLRETDADIVIATRPDLNGFLARDGRARYLRIGQEHLSLDAYGEETRENQNRAVAGLDAYITVSEADAEQYRRALPDVTTSIVCIPNSVPAPDVEPSTLRSNVVVAAGRLIPVKRYDRLIDAFAKIADDHPDWTLRLYGRGPEKPKLRERIDRLGLYDRIFLMGPVSPIETEWAKGAVAAVSSNMESFGMTIVEAMHCGVPVVATDCPHGPAEIIDHERNGLLVSLAGDVDEYAGALSRLISDEALRDRLGKAARERAADYAPKALAGRYEELFRTLHGQRYLEQEPPARRPARRRGLSSLLRLLRPEPKAAAQPAADTAGTTESEPAYRPVASARCTETGGISVRFEVTTLPPGRLDFVARLRRDPEGREVRLPVPDIATAPDLRDVHVTLLPGEHPLAEGRWDCYVVPRGSKRRTRLVSGPAERARRVGLPPLTGHDAVAAALPYTTADGFLALRAWRRPAHAEVDTVRVEDTHVRVTATLLTPGAAGPLDGASVVAVSRQDTKYDFTVPVGVLPEDRFAFSLDHDEAMDRRSQEADVWDLYLHRGAGHDPVPIGRIGGDVVDRNRTDIVPTTHLTHPTRGRTRVQAYFTATNDLALRARDTEDD